MAAHESAGVDQRFSFSKRLTLPPKTTAATMSVAIANA
jgi:hypothetical protein